MKKDKEGKYAACVQKFITQVNRLQGLQFFFRVGQNRIYTPYLTVYLVISLPTIPYIHRIYMVLANTILLQAEHSAV